MARAAALSVPALLLHGTADGPAEGGSEMTTVARARAFEATLVAWKIVDYEYFEGARHSALFYNADQRAHSVRRVADFPAAAGLGIMSLLPGRVPQLTSGRAGLSLREVSRCPRFVFHAEQWTRMSNSSTGGLAIVAAGKGTV